MSNTKDKSVASMKRDPNLDDTKYVHEYGL